MLLRRGYYATNAPTQRRWWVALWHSWSETETDSRAVVFPVMYRFIIRRGEAASPGADDWCLRGGAWQIRWRVASLFEELTRAFKAVQDERRAPFRETVDKRLLAFRARMSRRRWKRAFPSLAACLQGAPDCYRGSRRGLMPWGSSAMLGVAVALKGLFLGSGADVAMRMNIFQAGVDVEVAAFFRVVAT